MVFKPLIFWPPALPHCRPVSQHDRDWLREAIPAKRGRPKIGSPATNTACLTSPRTRRLATAAMAHPWGESGRKAILGLTDSPGPAAGCQPLFVEMPR